MKTAALLFAATLALASAKAQDVSYFSSAAAHRASDPEGVVRSLSGGLESRNEGVIVSALAHISRLQLYFPERRFPDIEMLVSRLSLDGPSPEIRYRAYLTSTLMTNPALFADECRMDFRTPDELFGALAQKMQKSMLGYDHAEGGK